MNIKPPRAVSPIVRQLFDEARRQRIGHVQLATALQLHPANMSGMKHGRHEMKLWQAEVIASCLGLKLNLESESCGQVNYHLNKESRLSSSTRR